MFTFHIYVLTQVSGSGEDGDGVTGENTAQSVAADRDCVSTFLSVTPLVYFKENLRPISRSICGDQSMYFRQNMTFS